MTAAMPNSCENESKFQGILRTSVFENISILENQHSTEFVIMMCLFRISSTWIENLRTHFDVLWVLVCMTFISITVVPPKELKIWQFLRRPCWDWYPTIFILFIVKTFKSLSLMFAAGPVLFSTLNKFHTLWVCG